MDNIELARANFLSACILDIRHDLEILKNCYGDFSIGIYVRQFENQSNSRYLRDYSVLVCKDELFTLLVSMLTEKLAELQTELESL